MENFGYTFMITFLAASSIAFLTITLIIKIVKKEVLRELKKQKGNIG